MNTSFYTTGQFDSAQLQQAQERAQSLAEDRDYASAIRKLERAEANMQQLESQLSTIKNVDARLRYNQRRVELRDEVANAKKEVASAKNAHVRMMYLAKLEEQRAQQQKVRDEAQSAHAKEEEQAAKREYKAFYLLNGGTDAQFEQAWPGIWQEQLAREAENQLLAAKHSLMQSRGYAL